MCNSVFYYDDDCILYEKLGIFEAWAIQITLVLESKLKIIININQKKEQAKNLVSRMCDKG